MKTVKAIHSINNQFCNQSSYAFQAGYNYEPANAEVCPT